MFFFHHLLNKLRFHGWLRVLAWKEAMSQFSPVGKKVAGWKQTCEKKQKRREDFYSKQKSSLLSLTPWWNIISATRQANLPILPCAIFHFQAHAEMFFCPAIKLFRFYLTWPSKPLRSVTYIWVLKSCVGSRGEQSNIRGRFPTYLGNKNKTETFKYCS